MSTITETIFLYDDFQIKFKKYVPVKVYNTRKVIKDDLGNIISIEPWKTICVDQ